MDVLWSNSCGVTGLVGSFKLARACANTWAILPRALLDLLNDARGSVAIPHFQQTATGKRKGFTDSGILKKFTPYYFFPRPEYRSILVKAQLHSGCMKVGTSFRPMSQAASAASSFSSKMNNVQFSNYVQARETYCMLINCIYNLFVVPKDNEIP